MMMSPNYHLSPALPDVRPAPQAGCFVSRLVVLLSRAVRHLGIPRWDRREVIRMEICLSDAAADLEAKLQTFQTVVPVSASRWSAPTQPGSFDRSARPRCDRD